MASVAVANPGPIARRVVSRAGNKVLASTVASAESVAVAVATEAIEAAVARHGVVATVPNAGNAATVVTALRGCPAKSVAGRRNVRSTSRARRPAVPTWSRCRRRWASARARWARRTASVRRKSADVAVAVAVVAVVVVGSVVPVKEDS